jgi:hypothetical protein
MTIFKVAIEDYQAEELKKLLRDAGFFKFAEEEQIQEYHDYRNSHNRIRNLLDTTKTRNLLKV